MAAKLLTAVPGTNPALFGYPDGAHFLIHQNDAIQVHEIWYPGAPGASFNSAPNGSVLRRTDNGHLYHKYGTLGSNNGTWVTVALA